MTRVDWTPVFARGRVCIYVVDSEEAARDSSLPSKLTDSVNLGKFVRNVLPKILEAMKTKWKWADIPRTIVHDPASYMVTTQHARLHIKFAKALKDGGFRSWVGGDGSESTEWLVKKWGDVYPHETLIANIRRLLDEDFCCRSLCETPRHFRERMRKVENHCNSKDFVAADGRGLHALAKSLRDRCQQVIDREGERIPK